MDRVKLIEAFRDFFYYGTKDSLQESFYNIHSISGRSLVPETIDWEQEEFTFNRLFIGPMTPLAPAVASVYLDPEGLIQGRVTREVREFFKLIGLSLPNIGSEPEDSIAFELDACRFLLLLCDKEPLAGEMYQGFINEHLALWIPEFSSRALEYCTESVAVKSVLVLLSQWVHKESGMTLTTKEVL